MPRICEYGFMRTTIDIPDRLGKQVKSRAALAGLSLKQFVTQALERQLAAGVEPSAPQQAYELPVVRSRAPGSMTLTPEEISAVLIREEATAYASDV